MTLRLVVAAGGTGGHLVPALAVADAVRRLAPSAEIAFVGTRKGMEREMVPAAGYRVHVTSVRPLTRDVRGLLAPATLLPAVAQARRILRRERATVVLGMGGYPSIPVVAAARTLRVPAVLHEQNVVPGLANELAARLTPHVAVSFPSAARAFRSARVVGVPLRERIASLDARAARPDALAHFELEPARGTVLVAGGSLGAVRLNGAVAGLVHLWRGRDDVQVLWSTGRDHHERVAHALPADAPRVRALPFVERMDLAYAAADVAVCRAGASTVAELAAVGVPAVLVPYPYARRREQDANARELVDAGAAVMLEDADLSGDRLARALDELLADEDRRARMRDAARSLARPHAAEELAAWLLELGAGRG